MYDVEKTVAGRKCIDSDKGDLFRSHYYASVNGANSIDLVFVVGTKDIELAMCRGTSEDADMIVQFYKSDVLTAAGTGIEESNFNRGRDGVTANSSGVVCTHTPTVKTPGTLLYSADITGPSHIDICEKIPFICKAGTQYRIRVTNGTVGLSRTIAEIIWKELV